MHTYISSDSDSRVPAPDTPVAPGKLSPAIESATSTSRTSVLADPASFMPPTRSSIATAASSNHDQPCIGSTNHSVPLFKPFNDNASSFKPSTVTFSQAEVHTPPVTLPAFDDLPPSITTSPAGHVLKMTSSHIISSSEHRNGSAKHTETTLTLTPDTVAVNGVNGSSSSYDTQRRSSMTSSRNSNLKFHFSDVTQSVADHVTINIAPDALQSVSINGVNRDKNA